MKIDRRLLLAGMAIAVTMFAAVSTSSASAAVWKDKGVNVTKLISIGLTGGEIFENNGASGMSCEIAATVTTEGGSTGKVTKWETKKCSGGFGEFAKCELATSESKNLPWTVDVNATDLTFTNMRIRRTFKAGCPITELDKTVTSTVSLLATPAAISEMDFTGSIAGPYKAFGTLKVEAAIAGTYGIG
ncbi:MAG TPA: hypothetical protein VEW07_10460 [Solirubrobacterales bacterium]|nr:hypothetical protein [Solirubrobacterales bacterium]